MSCQAHGFDRDFLDRDTFTDMLKECYQPPRLGRKERPFNKGKLVSLGMEDMAK